MVNNRFLLSTYETITIDDKTESGLKIGIRSIRDEEYKTMKIDDSKIVQVENKDSKHHEELQALDVVIGCIRNGHENNTDEYTKFLKQKKMKTLVQILKEKI